MGAKLPSPPLVLLPAAPLEGIDKRKGQDKREFRALGVLSLVSFRHSAFGDKATGVIPTTQTPNFSELFLGEMILVSSYEVSSYLLRARPLFITEGAPVRGLMFVSCMPSEVLGSSICLSAVVLRTEPFLGTSPIVLEHLRTIHFWDTF